MLCTHTTAARLGISDKGNMQPKRWMCTHAILGMSNRFVLQVTSKQCVNIIHGPRIWIHNKMSAFCGTFYWKRAMFRSTNCRSLSRIDVT